MQARTHWHDILGNHCPKFGLKRLVALPLPQPVGYKVADDYKARGLGCCLWLVVWAGRAAVVGRVWAGGRQTAGWRGWGC